MQNYWTPVFNVNGNSLPGPLIIGTFEKRAPGCYDKNKTYLSLMKDKEVFHVHEKEIWLLHLVS